jgi:bifunctional non-homologous end joining protein LigD
MVNDWLRWQRLAAAGRVGHPVKDRFALHARQRYEPEMLHPGFIEPCLPMMSRTVPTGAGWAYEIKHDGFRFICCRDSERVRCYSRGGHDWSDRLPAVVEAMRAFPVASVTLDGEVVICGTDGVSQFDRMSTVFGRRGSREAFLYAFDILELDGQELRGKWWDHRRALLVQLLAGANEGIRLWRAHRGHRRGRRVPRRVQHGTGGHRRQAPR